jgi:long-subunit acyl-CoA synthetase (AMP-forming)
MAAAYNGSCMLPLSSGDTLLCMLPLHHVFGFVCGLLWGLQCGAAVALGRGARYYTQDLSFYRPTVLSAVPMLLGFLLQHDLMNPDLQLVLVGAGDCPKALLAAAAARGISVSFGYGLTETSSGVAISVPPAYRVNPVSHTEADCNSDAAIAQGSSECEQSFDPYALEICPENAVVLAEDGEILVTGESCMMKGYYKEPEDTAAVLRDGVLYTGDLGRWDDNGRLHIIGRKKEILVLHDGTKLFLPEYEARIAVVLPGRDFAVLERDGRPVLLLVDPEAASAEPGSPAADKARALVLGAIRPIMASLPRGQQISAVLFTGKALPRTATGKIKRWELSRC